jgi:NitT/TauT family transport system ATP-binding protein
VRQIGWLPMMTDTSFFDFDGASYAYESGATILSTVDWRIPEGAFHCLVGRSGCGKTTLLKLAAGLMLPTQGQVRVKGEVIKGPSQKVGFVFQTPALLEWLPVIDNVLLPISLHRLVQAEDRDNALELLELVGIADLAKRYPRQLSGGQQSRAALARVLLPWPPALLMDEPFAALDAITREELQDDLLRLVSLRKTTVLFVTHDITEAVYLGDQVAVMEQGQISRVVTIDLKAPRSKNFRHETNFSIYCQSIREAMVQKMPEVM